MNSIATRDKYRYISPERVRDDEKMKLEDDLFAHLDELNEVGLLSEGRQLCEAMLPLLDDYTQTLIKERLLPLLLKVE